MKRQTMRTLNILTHPERDQIDGRVRTQILLGIGGATSAVAAAVTGGYYTIVGLTTAFGNQHPGDEIGSLLATGFTCLLMAVIGGISVGTLNRALDQAEQQLKPTSPDGAEN